MAIYGSNFAYGDSILYKDDGEIAPAFNIDFVGTPRRGTSPLIVDFTATVKFEGTPAGKYKAKQYIWYFDIGRYPETYETATIPTISHTYTGYYGQTFDVKLKVEIELV